MSLTTVAPNVGGTGLTAPGTSGNVLTSNGSAWTSVASTGAKAWVNFNGTGTVAIRGSFNVSSVTDNGTGLYTVNFTNAMPDANYSAVIGVSLSDTNNGMICNIFNDNNTPIAPTTSGFRIMVARRSDGTNADSSYLTAAVFG
jgi:hypothetical protein